ncbi:MAG: enoyl-CoA hydratase/isomerase family protein [Desulfobacteraceae bacterium]
MGIMEWEKKGSVAIITMTNGENRQNIVFADTMNRFFDEILADETISSLVLTSGNEKNFSQGIDIEWLGERFNEQDHGSIKSFMYGMNRVFSRLLLMPVPVIAAINGHAFGNGAMLACACDFRFMNAHRGYFCFPEVDLGIPFLPGMVAFVRKAVPEYKFNEMKLTGRRLTAEELARHHIIEKACDSIVELNQDVMAFAGSFNKKRAIFGEHKKRMHKKIVEVIDTDDPEFIDSLNLFVQ